MKLGRKVVIGFLIVCVVVATVAAILLFVKDGHTKQEDDAGVTMAAAVSGTDEEEKTVQMQQTEEESSAALEKQSENSSPDGDQEPFGAESEPSDAEKEALLRREYSDVETNVWKTEECYRHTQEGGEYLHKLIEYDSRDNVVRECSYDEDGSLSTETVWNNRYNREGKLVRRSGILSQSSLYSYSFEEFDGEERVINRNGYDDEGRVTWTLPFSYDYDEQENLWYCDYMALYFDENEEYTSSGFSNHEVSSYDEQGRITARYQYAYMAQYHMYNKTEEEIKQEMAEILQESEKPVSLESLIMEYEDDVPIEVYRYDGEGNLQEIYDYHMADGTLSQKASCTYEYDSMGNIKKSRTESEFETVIATYNRSVLQNNCGIKEVTWEEEEDYFAKRTLRFVLENGTVTEREATYDGLVDHVEYRDITGDGVCEALVFINMPNNYTDQYYRIAIYQVQEGNVADLSPFAEFRKEAAYWVTEIVEESGAEYGIVLQMDSYDKILSEEGPVLFVDERLTVAYRDGVWEELSRESNPDGIDIQE